MLANKRTMPSFETSIFYHIQLAKEGACVASSYTEIRISASLNAEERGSVVNISSGTCTHNVNGHKT